MGGAGGIATAGINFGWKQMLSFLVLSFVLDEVDCSMADVTAAVSCGSVTTMKGSRAQKASINHASCPSELYAIFTKLSVDCTLLLRPTHFAVLTPQ